MSIKEITLPQALVFVALSAAITVLALKGILPQSALLALIAWFIPSPLTPVAKVQQ